MEHGLEIRLMRFPLRHEPEYVVVKRAQAIVDLRERWLLHPANGVRRLPAKPSIIELGLAAAWERGECS